MIDIDEKTYNDIKKGKVYSSIYDVPQESVLAIANGTPLPKGHGDLIDRDNLYDYLCKADAMMIVDALSDGLEIDELPTIIEADEEVENERI